MATVLLIEDDPLFGALVEEVLGHEGYAVIWRTTGPEGLAAAESESPDVIMLDLMLPEVDGWTVLRELKKNAATRATPVIMSSAVVDRSTDIERALAEAVLRKPFGIEELLSTVRAVLARAAR
jgi:two-component system, OmpR family, response regulator PfeR